MAPEVCYFVGRNFSGKTEAVDENDPGRELVVEETRRRNGADRFEVSVFWIVRVVPTRLYSRRKEVDRSTHTTPGK
ncbi:hypothetical protein Q1695_012864 [Nippostrongylus brasiliensis]|nr:hypothetical protein Q1695_012864 [Nippostrongylus brasiliensis]